MPHPFPTLRHPLGDGVPTLRAPLGDAVPTLRAPLGDGVPTLRAPLGDGVPTVRHPAFVLGLIVVAGCGASPPPPPAPDGRACMTAADAERLNGRELQIADGGYVAVNPPPGQVRCDVQRTALPAACGGAQDCPVTGVEIASCNMPVSEVTVSGGTAVLGVGQEQQGKVPGFAVWPAGGPIRIVTLPGTAPRPARRANGQIAIVRVEQAQIADYVLVGDALLRRAWKVERKDKDQVTSAAWAGDRLFARLTAEPSQAWGYDDVAITDNHLTVRSDLRLPATTWGAPWSQAREADGKWLSVGYGSSGVGIFTGLWGYGVPRTTAQNGTHLRALVGGAAGGAAGSAAGGVAGGVAGRAAAGGAPVIAFLSFDPNDRSGVHVILPNEPFPSGATPAKVPVQALDLHITGSRASRKSDCPTEQESKARACTRSESYVEGLGLARTPSDGQAWIAFYVTVSEHTATAKMVCPDVHCKRGQPCAQPVCQLQESNPKDTTRTVLRLYRIAPGRVSLEKALDMTVGASATPGETFTLEMDGDGAILHLVHRIGTDRIQRLTIDTSRVGLVAPPPGEVQATPITLAPMEGG